jgi:membrane associated rhomboid family serine protease
MLIPIAHEDLRGRRWPYVTIVIIVLNTMIFLGTNGRMEKEYRQTWTVQLHILLLNAKFPDAPMPEDVEKMVTAFHREHAGIFQEMQAPRPTPIDGWDAQLLAGNWSEMDADAEMIRLSAFLEQERHESLAWNYAFHPFHPTAISYITANFLHGGWLHLIFNMWFLWLAGTILEDAWGRVVYPIFYLVCGAMAMMVHAMVFRDSFVPVVGASGAIAGLMGAFLARFPKTRIKLAWVVWIRVFKFYVPAFIILPLWLVIQVFWGVVAGSEAGVAYWAHVGGFAFGMLGAVALRMSGIEQAADQSIEAKVSWTANPRIQRATDYLSENQLNPAIGELQQLVKEQPDSIDGYELLLKAQQRRQDYDGARETLGSLCRLSASSDPPTAWNYYEQYLNCGGDRLPRGVWLELCRYAESQQNWERAAEEYQRFAEKNSSERSSVPALVSAARICMLKLNRRADAEKLFRAAESSPAPHVDLDAAIQEGLKLCAPALPPSRSF